MNYKYIYGPIASRRLGFSLGISTMPKKTCNYSCVYCQLGRTNHLTNTRQMFYPVEDILLEFDQALKENLKFDVVSIVGEGEPSLYLGLGSLISEIKKRVDKPVSVITNGALLYDSKVRAELNLADIVLPSLNAYDDHLFKMINRSYGRINFHDTFEGLKIFSHEYKGQIWLEIMLVEGFNDDDQSLERFEGRLKEIRYDRLYLNTPVRPPAESFIKPISKERMKRAVEVLHGIPIDLLCSLPYQSGDEDDFAAIISIIERHPLNQHEITEFLKSRGTNDPEVILKRLKKESAVEMIDYKGYHIYRLK
jgi:wyosine [tRNA(Phe)-imidazoG37] synthetase (radical SAM superfamily)